MRLYRENTLERFEIEENSRKGPLFPKATPLDGSFTCNTSPMSIKNIDPGQRNT